VLVVPELEEILTFCGEDPVERVLLEDVARRGLGRFTAVGREDGSLKALCHVGANVVPSGEGCEQFADITVDGNARMIIGEEGAVSVLWGAARRHMGTPREDRPGQPVYVLDEPPEPGETELRNAVPEDFDLLLPACAQAHELELGVNPIERDREGFRWRTRAQIDEGRSWIWAENGMILFKAEASAWTPTVVQIAQVWVDPEVRNRGYAKRGMRDLCRRLLELVPTVTLFVRRENAPAIRVYEAIGMRRTITYRSLIF
jgi:hypothetical protein